MTFKRIDEIEPDAADDLAAFRAEIGHAAAAPIDSPARRLEAWSTACLSAQNVLSVDGITWSWDTRPRLQKNGAAIGRVYLQAPGQFPRDVGAYKIGADGRVLELPAELRAVLPGGLEAEDQAQAAVDQVSQPELAP